MAMSSSMLSKTPVGTLHSGEQGVWLQVAAPGTTGTSLKAGVTDREELPEDGALVDRELLGSDPRSEEVQLKSAWSS